VNNCREMQTQVEETDLDTASATTSASTTSYPRAGIPLARAGEHSRTNVLGDTSLLFRPTNVLTTGISYRYDTPNARKWEEFVVRNTAGAASSVDTGVADGIDADFPAKRPKIEE